MNTKYTITGSVDVIIRTLTDAKINGKQYAAGEPIAYIKDTAAMLNYGGVTKDVKQVSKLISFTETYPDSINIMANAFKDAVLKLFGKLNESPTIGVPKMRMIETDESGSVFLESNIDNVFVYDMEMEKIINFTFDSESGSVTNLDPDTFYYIDYKINMEDYVGYSLGDVSLPYLTIELKGTGNFGRSQQNFFMRIKKTTLNMNPAFNFDNSSIAKTDIKFSIIRGKGDSGVEVYFY